MLPRSIGVQLISSVHGSAVVAGVRGARADRPRSEKGDGDGWGEEVERRTAKGSGGGEAREWGYESGEQETGRRERPEGVDALSACRYPWKFNHAVPL